MRKLKHVCAAFHLTLSSLLTHGFLIKNFRLKHKTKKNCLSVPKLVNNWKRTAGFLARLCWVLSFQNYGLKDQAATWNSIHVCL